MSEQQTPKTVASEHKDPSPEELSHGLARIRKCRWFFFGVVLIYVPALLATLRLSQSGRTTATMFGIWVFFLVVSVVFAAIVKCPRCKQYFHTNGPTFLPVRKCVHCGLPVNADKRKKQAGQAGLSK